MDWMLGLGALLGGAAALTGVGTSIGLGASAQEKSAEAAERQTAEAIRQFDANMAWQKEQYYATQNWLTEMSNTAHQREVKDLIAAGLNPVLSATGGSGASSPSMSSPSSVGSTASAAMADYTGAMNIIQSGLNSAMQNGLQSVATFSQAAKNSADAAAALADASQKKDLTPAMKDNFIAQAQAASAQAGFHIAQANNLDALTPVQVSKMQEEIQNLVTSGAGLRIDNSYKARMYEDQLLNSAARRKFEEHTVYNQYINNAVRGAKAASDILGDWMPGAGKVNKIIRGFMRSSRGNRISGHSGVDIEGASDFQPSSFDVLGF